MHNSIKLPTASRAALLATCAAGVLFAAGTARAADAPAPDAASVAAPTDIVVTATRRNESIQSVPMTIQALSGRQLGELNVTTFGDLLKYTPNVTFASNGPGQGAIFMRGLSTGFAGNQSSGTIAPFPNVALYLDDQSMQFPARNADVYMADISRVEVLEGPQGTLFGGGAEAGAVRYITNKPDMKDFTVHVEGSAGGTVGGAPNASINATVNVPIVRDTLAVRATFYRDHQGGYIDNVASTFTRRATDAGAEAYGYTPTASNQSNGGQYNNYGLAKSDYNPVDYIGGRVEAQWNFAPDWDLLVTESYQRLDAQGESSTYPTGSDGQSLGALQTTVFTPAYNIDQYWNTAWNVNGKIGDWKIAYAGAYMSRRINEQQDYTNYSRTAGGMYYQCSGGQFAFGHGSGTGTCNSPIAYWHDNLRNTHHSEELRLSSPENKRLRVIGGAYYEKFNIDDIMNFDYLTVPNCTSALLSAGTTCSGVTATIPGAYANKAGNQPDGAGFGEDDRRGYRQFAFFGSVDFDVLPNVTITGGTRYYNYKEYEEGSEFYTVPSNCQNVLVCPGSDGAIINGHVTYHGFKSKGEIAWKPKPGTMVYGLFSQGFRPGGFNRTSSGVLPGSNGVDQYMKPSGYAPDTLTNWEVGFKTDLLDHKVTFNLSAYYMIWDNVQIGFFDPAGGFGNTSFDTNGANFHVKGLEAQIAARPVSGLTLNLGATYNHSKQVSAPCFVSNYAGSATLGQCITSTYSSGTATAVTSPFGAIGDSLPYSPSVQGNLRARYEWAGGERMNWFVSGGVSYTGPMFNEPSTYPSGDGTTGVPTTTLLRYHMDGYALLDASIGFKRDNYSVSLFGSNLTNTHASTWTSSAQFIKSEVPVRPMTYGLKMAVDFK